MGKSLRQVRLGKLALMTAPSKYWNDRSLFGPFSFLVPWSDRVPLLNGEIAAGDLRSYSEGRQQKEQTSFSIVFDLVFFLVGGTSAEVGAPFWEQISVAISPGSARTS